MNESKSSRYQRLRRRAEGVSGVASAALLVACLATPLGGSLAAWARGVAAGLAAPWRPVSEVIVLVAALAAVLEALALPVVVYVGVRLDRRYKRAEKSVGGLVSAQLHVAAVGVGAAVVVGIVVHVSARMAGAWWWVVTGVTLSAAFAAAVRGVSSLIARSRAAAPLRDPDLDARLGRVSADIGVPVAGIFQWRADDHDDHTASVTGFGRGRRILLAPDVVRDWSQDEIAVVVAHELSHHKHHDLIQALAFDAVLVSAALAVADVALRLAGAPAGALLSLPLIALVAGGVWVAVTPARHALSRWQERRADQFALAVTGHADAFSAAVRRLGERHLAEERPSALTRWFFHRHPSVAERLAMAARR